VKVAAVDAARQGGTAIGQRGDSSHRAPAERAGEFYAARSPEPLEDDEIGERIADWPDTVFYGDPG
jgi:hypothetical protein